MSIHVRVCSTTLASISLAALAVFSARSLSAADFEANPSFDAAAVLGAAKAKGEHYEVLSPVTTDGFLLAYRIRSDFGSWEVEGRPLLELRLREVGALAELAELSRTKVFTDAVAEGVKKATLGQVETVQAFADRPVETVKAIPGGISRTFRRVKAQAGEAVDDYQASREESAEKTTGEKTSEATDAAVDAGKAYGKKYLGVGAAERRWAQKLGVDPYSSNEILRKQIAAVAKVDAAGRFGVRFVGIPSIPGLNYVRDVNKLVWETDPNELRLQNRKILQTAGASEKALAKFFDNEWLSPSLQTAITHSIADLSGVAERGRLVAQAGEVDSEAGAWFLAQGLRLLVDSHTKRAPLTRILDGSAAPLAEAKGGTVVAGLATEHLSWSESLATGLARIRAEHPKATAFEALVSGKLTDRARSELASAGVRVVEGLRSALEAAAGGARSLEPRRAQKPMVTATYGPDIPRRLSISATPSRSSRSILR